MARVDCIVCGESTWDGEGPVCRDCRATFDNGTLEGAAKLAYLEAITSDDCTGLATRIADLMRPFVFVKKEGRIDGPDNLPRGWR